MDPMINSHPINGHGPNANKGSLLIKCLLMDAIGYLSYSLPFFGELGDLIWAPISALVFYKTFGGWKGKIGTGINFLEEIIPGLDFIPSFTLMYFFRSGKKKLRQSMDASPDNPLED